MCIYSSRMVIHSFHRHTNKQGECSARGKAHTFLPKLHIQPGTTDGLTTPTTLSSVRTQNSPLTPNYSLTSIMMYFTHSQLFYRTHHAFFFLASPSILSQGLCAFSHRQLICTHHYCFFLPSPIILPQALLLSPIPELIHRTHNFIPLPTPMNPSHAP